MIARVGASVSLSLCIVAGATLIVHRPEHPPLAAEIAKPSAPQVVAKHAMPSAAPPVSRPESKIRSVSARGASPPKPRAVPARKRPESAFTKVRTGETLADVVERVYGSGVGVRDFWKVNRDQIAEMDAHVKPGMVLRTPEFP
jgi:nucleoid-associated protein YgaU